MTLPVPNLDDRTFLDLVREARARVQHASPEWTDLSVHDPGMVLIEAFAHLTEVMLYRLNKIPEKAYVEFLNLLGVTRNPPAAAWADLTVRRATGDSAVRITVPAGTRVVATSRADPRPVTFVVTESAVLAAGDSDTTVRAHHCEAVDGELLGTGTGRPGQVLRAAGAPIVTTTEPIDILLGVEVEAGAVVGGGAREHGGRTFEIWRPVPSFAGRTPHDKVYLLDRSIATVTFAPVLDPRVDPTPLAAVPAAGREIRLWYRTGGGPDGNVGAGTLTTLRDPIAGVTVTNAHPARGGIGLEPIEDALRRGPHEFFALARAVTAGDFELLATAGAGAVSRAKAFTRAAMWSFARPGEVEVVLVPYVPRSARTDWLLPQEVLVDHEVEEARARAQADLDRRRALGTSVVATWARYKAVSIRARVVVRPEEDVDAVRLRIHDRLYQALSPLPTDLNPSGWAFGEPLRASNVYRMLEQAEPGVRYVDDVRFVLADAPDQRVPVVAADAHQAGTWYAGSQEVLFRSTNGGRGWEPVARFPDEDVRRIVPTPAAARPGITARPGSVVVVTRRRDGTGSGVHVSTDLGQTWRRVAELEPVVTDVAWIERDGATALLLATDVGLYELSLLPRATPLQVMVDRADPDRGFYAVRAFVSERGAPAVALAGQAQYGVYLSTAGGTSGTFTDVGLSGMDTRTLAVQYDGPATLLWVGLGEPDANRSGRGCVRARLFEADVRWEMLSAGWTGGTCWSIDFAGRVALAATQSGGVLRQDTTAAEPQWEPASVNGGLPLRDRTRFEPVESVAWSNALALAGGTRGVQRSPDGLRWQSSANRETTEVVTVPETWLLCSAEHQIEVVRDNAQRGD